MIDIMETERTGFQTQQEPHPTELVEGGVCVFDIHFSLFIYIRLTDIWYRNSMMK